MLLNLFYIGQKIGGNRNRKECIFGKKLGNLFLSKGFIIIIIIFIYLPSDVTSQEKTALPLGLSPKH